MKMLHDQVTIVVPSKNEQDYIAHLLHALREQAVGTTRIIIADCSTDKTREVILANSHGLNVQVIEGGPVSVAKNRAAALATTPYILFIDADVRFFEPAVIWNCVQAIDSKNLDLVGLNVRCYDSDRRAQLAFGLFNSVNCVLKHFSPFAVGAFMLVRTDRFVECGGFPEHCATSEDYFLSKQFSPRKFCLMPHYFGQDSRRFKKMGYFGMAAYLVKNFLNRNNAEYWQQLHHNRYWN
jgi:glycosyltransferase involved in cell wall biosynthesis